VGFEGLFKSLRRPQVGLFAFFVEHRQGRERPEHLIDRAQDDRRRAEVLLQGLRFHLQVPAQGREQAWLCGTPAVDGLLHVPHAKETLLATAVRTDVLGQFSENTPLNRGGVLELVQEQVVDGGVQPVGEFQITTCDRTGIVGRARSEGAGNVREIVQTAIMFDALEMVFVTGEQLHGASIAYHQRGEQIVGNLPQEGLDDLHPLGADVSLGIGILTVADFLDQPHF